LTKANFRYVHGELSPVLKVYFNKKINFELPPRSKVISKNKFPTWLKRISTSNFLVMSKVNFHAAQGELPFRQKLFSVLPTLILTKKENRFI
jgi:hypothetical protein